MSDWVLNEYGVISRIGMENNASIIREFFSGKGWSINAISAILGNMERESGINPARWQNDDVNNLSGGFGLVQWTPATKIIDWIASVYGDNYTNGDYQLERIQYELENGLQYAPTKDFKETFSEWAASNKNPGYLAAAFLCNYERAADTGWNAQMKRAKMARQWHIFLTGSDPGGWIPSGLLIIIKKSKERGCLF